MSNREIKFRVWNKSGNYWGEFEHFIGENYVGLEMHNDNLIVQQFTGLLDKNGKEIYEGDILVEYPENRQKVAISDDIYEVRDDLPRNPLADVVIRYGVVEYCTPQFQLKYKTISETTGACAGMLFYGDNYEVIGNIHENPELLA